MIGRRTLGALAAMIIAVAPGLTAVASAGASGAGEQPGTAKQAAGALAVRLAGRDSFRIGDKGVFCTAERKAEDPHYHSMFDRAYDVVCRDAAVPVGQLYALRDGPAATATIADLAGGCEASATEAPGSGLPALDRRQCRAGAGGLERRVYATVGKATRFVASGLAAYDSALRLGLAALVADRLVAGTVAVAATGNDDPAQLARLQAERLDPTQALASGLTQANDGSFADAAEYFDRLVARARLGEAGADRPGEYLLDEAVAQSLLGNRAQAEPLFNAARAKGNGADPNFARLYRNLVALHLLDGHHAAAALALLDGPLPTIAGAEPGLVAARVAAGYIDRPLAQRLTLDASARHSFASNSLALTDAERAALLDAQGLALRGEAERQLGHPDAARSALTDAENGWLGVRGGHVLSMAWLPARVALTRARLAEAEGHLVEADAQLRSAITTLTRLSPDTATLIDVRAQAAAFAARHGALDAALDGYRQLVDVAPRIAGGGAALRAQIGPYFAALATRFEAGGADTARIPADMFRAAQTLVRPGVAQTQAVLARQLSGGSDEAADLFRQSLALGREVHKLDAALAELIGSDGGKSGTAGSTPNAGPDAAAVAALTARRAEVAAQQTAIQARLGGFARFRAVSDAPTTLADLQAVLRPGEAWYKLIEIDDAAYALWVTAQTARVLRVGASPATLETAVDTLRDSIVSHVGGQVVTNPFDLVTARRLFLALFAPVAGELAGVQHLVFEPDGALLKLPITVLPMTQAGVDAYGARQAAADADAFDFTGVAWLGRDRMVTTSVSARSFIDVRTIAPSTAPRRYLGLGQNTVLAQSAHAPDAAAPRDPCAWPLATWNHPVSGAELTLAAQTLGDAATGGNVVLTGEDFTDTALRERADLGQFRVVQFATHGLVTAPRPGCPAEPELVTSFGAGDSHGLLTFRDIFNLRLNADTVILSACDTAGAASIDTTRAAGITTGGNFALDGLVRAFVGAGARSVIASHWPVPDDFHATAKLMGGLFRSGLGTSVGEALRRSQQALMDDPLTSHPYYWAAFAVVGDAAKPLSRP